MKLSERFLSILIVLVIASLPMYAAKQLFSLTLAKPIEALKIGSELRVDVTVTNTADRPIGFIRSPGLIPEDGFRYQIEVRNAQGESAPPSAHVRHLKNSKTIDEEISRSAYWLKPGESFVDDLEITKFYDLREPGNYTITVTREIPPAQKLGEGKIKSNTISVTVVP